MTTPESAETVIAPAAEIARRMPTLAGFVEKFDPHLVVVVPIASFIFAADLLRLGTLPKLPVYFLNVLPRQQDDLIGTHRISAPRNLPSLEAKRILLLDSCRDSGKTLARLKAFLSGMGIERLMTLVAVDKNQPDAATKCSGSLFKFDDELAKVNPHIFGYGMDDEDGSNRGLSYIAYRRVAASS